VSKPGFGAALACEWTKLRTVKSTFWTLLATVVVSTGVSFLIALAYTTSYDRMTATDRARFDPAAYGLSGLNIGVIALAVLGVMVVTAEYSTGMIRTSLTAVPSRRRLLSAKVLVLLAVSLVIGTISSFAAFWLSQLVFRGRHLDTSLAADGILRAVTGGGLYLAMIALFALGVGTILRHTAGSITTVLGVLFVLPIVGAFLPGQWGETVQKLLPAKAGSAIMGTHPQSDLLAPWTGLGLFCLYTAIVLVVAYAMFQKRDA
jgi:ABC-type transport system involved in multi-copper enzyme maturation permease subunit